MIGGKKMKIITIVVSVLAIITLLSTLICGLWISKQPEVDPSSLLFHLRIGIASVILVIASIIMLLVSK